MANFLANSFEYCSWALAFFFFFFFIEIRETWAKRRPVRWDICTIYFSTFSSVVYTQNISHHQFQSIFSSFSCQPTANSYGWVLFLVFCWAKVLSFIYDVRRRGSYFHVCWIWRKKRRELKSVHFHSTKKKSSRVVGSSLIILRRDVKQATRIVLVFVLVSFSFRVLVFFFGKYPFNNKVSKFVEFPKRKKKIRLSGLRPTSRPHRHLISQSALCSILPHSTSIDVFLSLLYCSPLPLARLVCFGQILFISFSLSARLNYYH